MGRATRWLRGLLGGKKQAKGAAGQKPSNSAAVWEEQPQGKGKKRWTLTKTDDGEAVRPECSRWASTKDGDKERDVAGKRDVTVAADAAAVAVEVVRLTSCEGAGRERGLLALRFGKHGDWWAAVCIQTAFRGFLARKALRALKALVKLQALVRGYLVRKQAAATLHSMEALIRAQVTVRMHKFGVLPKSSSYGADVHQKDIRHYPLEVRPRRSLERLDDSRSENATASFHSRRMSANLDHASSGFDDSPKIVEVDPGRNNRRTSDCVNPTPTPSEEYSTTDDTPQSRSSPLTINTPPSRIVTPSAAPDWELDQQCHRRSLPATAHSTPRLPRTSPAKSACGWSEVVRPPRWEHGHQLNQQHQLGHYSHPRFMAGTQSSKAKARSQSAPKQRPDPRRRLTLNEMVEARASLSGIRMQRSCSRAHQDSTAGFKGSGGPTATPVPRSCELGKGAYERDAEFLDHDIHHHLGLQRRW